MLLDECVTSYLKREFVGREAHTVEEAGVKGLKNGRPLQAASGRFDALVTVGQNLRRQQNLHTFAIAVVVLKSRRSTYPMLKPLMPKVLEPPTKIKSGEVFVVG